MKRLLFFACLAGGCALPDPYLPSAIRIESVPPIPRALAERMARYEEIRGTRFRGWGPDGAMLVSKKAESVTQLHLVSSPGGDLLQLTSGDDPIRGGLFIPSTGDLLFSRGSGGDEQYQIYRRDHDTGAVAMLTDGKSRCIPGPLNNAGDRLVYRSNHDNGRDMDLYLLDVATGRSTLLRKTDGQTWIPSSWAPDDSKLLIQHYVSANRSKILIMDFERDWVVAYEPENKSTAVAALRFSASPYRIYYSSDEKGEFKRLASRELHDHNVRWSGELPWDVVDIEVHGDRVAFITNEGGVSRLSVMTGGIVSPIDLPDGVLSGLEFSPDGKRLGFTLDRPDAPPDAYSYDLEEDRRVRWTVTDTGTIDPATFVAPERITFESFDGRKIPAFIYRPPSIAKPPVLIYIHGGPESQYRPRFWSTLQFWLSELEVAVIAPNVRGSAGYGKTYVALDNGMKREDSVRDIGALLDWIEDQPDLDSSRVAVYGGSYGGYMVLASLARFGERLCAGIDIVGIANFVSFLERTSRYRVDLRRAEYGDERDPAMRSFLERISPSNQADRIRSPLMVVHGANDPRVKLFETELIAARVRRRGRPAWTIVAENEGHGFARRENRAYLGAAMTLFLRRFLVE